ncbi:alpha/beta hydrolase [Polaromonas sp.]|uniref:alpha/beta fold hydrolase n=1 Tax=Polaromonas sp. TaxID=1869339 RepID=UPI0017FEB94E|nr:alpha/beta hydrolase [Polaromonas sp.]NMM06369.1 alpha/beta hydrolase [Polaromonas sp.]
MYKEKRSARSEFVPIRGLSYHVRIWDSRDTRATAASAGPPQAKPAPLGGSVLHEVKSVGAPLFLLHGWMDVAASYQFMVDAFSDAFAAGRNIIAPDWRGFGQTRSSPSQSGGQADNYWPADYLADLDFLLDHYAPGQAVDLVGHSMGGNVAMLYAGVRPERVRKLVNLEGFGLPVSKPSQAPGRYAQWMDELKSLQRGELDLKTYNDVGGVARRLMRTNPRLSVDKANWLACHWARPDAEGKWKILGEPAHKVTSAQLYRLDEVIEIYRCISAPMLAVEASSDSMQSWWQGKYTLDEYHERLKQIPHAQVAVIQDAGHMLHHDQPGQLAQLIADFLS